MKTHEIPIDLLRSFLSYDPRTGEIRWLKRSEPRASRTNPGDIAGCLNGQGYRVIGFKKKLINAHQIAWALHYGEWSEMQIDHINCDKSDNRIENLREATNTLNHANIGLMKSNTSGRKGVTWNKRLCKWQASIKIEGRQKHLGLFHDIEQAHAAYVKAANDNFKQFARTA